MTSILASSAGSDSDHAQKETLNIIPIEEATKQLSDKEHSEEEGATNETSEEEETNRPTPTLKEMLKDFSTEEEESSEESSYSCEEEEEDEEEEEEMDVDRKEYEDRLSYAMKELEVLHSYFERYDDKINPVLQTFKETFPEFPSYISKCPDKILSNIFSYLPRDTIGPARSVCKKWNKVIHQDPEGKKRNKDKVRTRVISWNGPSVNLTRATLPDTKRTIKGIRRDFPTFSSWVKFVTRGIAKFHNLSKVIVDLTSFKFFELIWHKEFDESNDKKKKKDSPFIIMIGKLMDSLSQYKRKIESFGFMDNPRFILPSPFLTNYKDVGCALSSLVRFDYLKALDLTGISTYKDSSLSYDIYSRISNLSKTITTLKSIAFPGLVTLGSREHYALVKYRHVYASSIFIPYLVTRKYSFLRNENTHVYKHQSWAKTQKTGLIKKARKNPNKGREDAFKFTAAPSRKRLLNITAKEVLCKCCLKEKHWEKDNGSDVDPFKRDYFEKTPHCENKCLHALVTDMDLKIRSLCFSFPNNSKEFVKDEEFSFFKTYNGNTPVCNEPSEIPGRDIATSLLEYNKQLNVIRIIRKRQKEMKVVDGERKEEVKNEHPGFYRLLSKKRPREETHSSVKSKSVLYDRLYEFATSRSFEDIVESSAEDVLCKTRPFNNPILYLLNLCINLKIV
jgi:hypothetical protein